jgi:hypothetical protein
LLLISGLWKANCITYFSSSLSRVPPESGSMGNKQQRAWPRWSWKKRNGKQHACMARPDNGESLFHKSMQTRHNEIRKWLSL